jgi:hypothetical protein
MYPRVIRLNKLLSELKDKGITKMKMEEFEKLIEETFGISTVEFYIREGIRYDLLEVDTKNRVFKFKPMPMATLKALYREGKLRGKKLKRGRKKQEEG